MRGMCLLLVALSASAAPLPGGAVSAPPPPTPLAALSLDTAVTALSWSPDGASVLASSDGAVRSLSLATGAASDLDAASELMRATWAGSTQVRAGRAGLTSVRADGKALASRATVSGAADLLQSRDGTVAWSADGAGAVVAWDVDTGKASGSHVVDGAHRLLGVAPHGRLAGVATATELLLLGVDGGEVHRFPHPDVHDVAISSEFTALSAQTGVYIYRNDIGAMVTRTSTTATAIAWADHDTLAMASGRTVRVWDLNDEGPGDGTDIGAGVRALVPIADGDVGVLTAAGGVHGLDAKGRVGKQCLDGAVAAVPWETRSGKPKLLVARADGLHLMEPRKCKDRGSVTQDGLSLVAVGAGTSAWAVDASCGRWAWGPEEPLEGAAGMGQCASGVVSPSGAALLHLDTGLGSRDQAWNPRPLLGVPGRVVAIAGAAAVVVTLDTAGGLSLWDAQSLSPTAVRASDAAHIALAIDGRVAISAHKEVAVLDAGSLQTLRRWGAEEPGALAWSADGTRVAFADGSGVVVVDPSADDPVGRWSETSPVSTVAWRPDGSGLAVGVGHSVVLRSP
ncbi:MAG: WD40 repeat protein, partial [Myxococcota bacterium]